MSISIAIKTRFRNIALPILALLAGSAAHAADFFVNAFDDRIDDDFSDPACHTNANTCTLRAAIMQANHTLTAGTVTVIHVPAGTYVLTRPPFRNDDEQTGDLNLAAPFAANQRIVVLGSGVGSTIIDANQIDRAFKIEAGRIATIAELTVRNGTPNSTGSGGGIYNVGTLSVSHCLIRDNIANYGGGIYSAGVLNVLASTVGPNMAYAWGGGLVLSGPTNVRESTIRDNAADSGGGILTYSDIVIVNSTLSGNTANTNGGGIFVLSGGGAVIGKAFVYNTSIVFNDADHDHDMNGGIGGGIYATAGGRFVVTNTLIAGNTQLGWFDDDCSGTLEAYGFNLLGNLAGCAFSGNGNAARGLVSLNTIDTVLRDNGGPTPTHALFSGSQAINAAPSGCSDETATLLATDQRGAPRVAGARCDVGAVEYGSMVPVDDAIFKNGFE